MSIVVVDMWKRKCGLYLIDVVFWNLGGFGIIVLLLLIVLFIL